MRKFVYIGNKFYIESGTRMGNFLEIVDGGYERAGLGDIEIALMEGDEVHARPANRKEIEMAKATLKRISKSKQSDW